MGEVVEIGMGCSVLCSHSGTQDGGGSPSIIRWLSSLACISMSSQQAVRSGADRGVEGPVGGFNGPDLDVDTLGLSIFCWPELSPMATSNCHGAWEMSSYVPERTEKQTC